jgi:uncharacterized protein YgiM (DUF1202 family)
MKVPLHLTCRSAAIFGAIGLAAVLGAAAAAVLYVNADRLDVVDKKRAVAKTVVTVDRNTPLNVIAKEGRWYKIEVGGKEGYVAETVVSTSPGSAKGKGVTLAAVKGGSIPELESAAAVKGLGEGTRQYASAGGLKTTGLEELIRRRDAVTPAEFDQFLTGGGLAGATGAPAPVDTTRLASSEVTR